MPELWPFAAAGQVSEVLEARTDLLQTPGAEQRIALRTEPREIVTLQHRLDALGMARAAEIARAGFASAWLVPLWHLAAQPTAALAQGSDEIAVDTTASDFRAGAQAAVAVDGGAASLITLSSVGSDTLTLEEAMVLQLPEPVVAPGRALVAPVRAGILTAPVEIARRRQGEGTVTASFLLSDPPTLTSPSGTSFLGRPVLTTPSILRQPLAATLYRAVEYVDNGFGPVVVEPVRDVFVRGEAVSLKAQAPAARWELRRFLWGLRGRQESFWLPSWGRDLQLTASMGAAATGMHIQPVAPIDAYAGRAIAFEIGGGLTCRSIVSAIESGVPPEAGVPPDEHVLTLSASLGVAVPVSTPVHFLTLSRSDSDRFEIAHGSVASEVTFPVVEVPDEL